MIDMKYAFARKFGQPSLAPSAFDPFHNQILRGVGAEEETESSSYSTGTVILALLGGLVVGAVAMRFYMGSPMQSAPAFVAPPPYRQNREDDPSSSVDTIRDRRIAEARLQGYDIATAGEYGSPTSDFERLIWPEMEARLKRGENSPY